MAVGTASGLIIPEFVNTSSVRAWCRAMDDRNSREAVAIESAATIAGAEWDALPGVNNSRYGRSGGTRAARHLRYIARLERQICKATDALWADYNALVYVPWRASQNPQGRFKPGQ